MGVPVMEPKLEPRMELTAPEAGSLGFGVGAAKAREVRKRTTAVEYFILNVVVEGVERRLLLNY